MNEIPQQIEKVHKTSNSGSEKKPDIDLYIKVSYK